jgi:hypothetical protein
MPLIQRWKPEPWEPTPAQAKAALHLADSLIGARGRTRMDGAAEVRAIDEGEIRSYVVWPDGTVQLVTARPVSGTYRQLEVARAVVASLAIAAIVWLVIAQALNIHEELLPFVAGLVGILFVTLFVSEIVMNRELEVPSEQWERIGGDD